MRCGGELEMGTSTLLADGRYGNAGPKDNPDPHFASEDGPARPALEALVHLPPAEPSDPPPPEHRDPYAFTVLWGRETPLGIDDSTARAHLFGDAINESAGAGFAGKRHELGGKAKALRVADSAPGARALPPRVVHTGLRVAGPLASARVADSMLTHLPTFRSCYSDRLKSTSQPGRLELTLRIAPDGSVTSGYADHNEAVDPSVVSCMVQASQTLRFDKAAAETTITYPLLLIPPAPVT